jgi:hypothetical protein
MRVFTISDANAVLRGLTIRDGRSSTGSGVSMSGGLVRDCIIRDNGYNDNIHGAGVYMTAGTVSNCTITANAVWSSGQGGGIRASGNSLILDCRILGNRAGKEVNDQNGYGGGIYMDGASVLVRNCLIARNDTGAVNDTGGQGAGVYLKDGTIESCTIVSNNLRRTGGAGEGGGVYRNGNGTVRNCIIYFNRDAAMNHTDNWYSTDTDVQPNYSCLTPTNGLPAGTTGNIDADPLFVNVASDYTLQASSPCIDTGVNQAWMVGATDLAGNARKIYGRKAGSRGAPIVDMGAYETYVDLTGTIIMLR